MKGGIGWQGKHTNLVSKTLVMVILSSILLIKKLIILAQKLIIVVHVRCIDVCPTNAIVEPYKLDATKCISYLTIEHKGIIDKLRKLIGNRIYGCDDCLAVCPWNNLQKI